jgi:hypothetical protein
MKGPGLFEETTEEVRKIALFDMDGTLADYQGTIVKDLNCLRSPTEDEFTIASIQEPVPNWLEARMDLIKAQPGWWIKLPQLADGFKVLKYAAMLGFTLQVCTKGPWKAVSGWTEKVIWCRENIDPLGFTGRGIDITTTMDKSQVYGTVLVEDWVPYVRGWLRWRKRGIVILLDRPYNQGFEHPQVTRVNFDKPETVENMRKALIYAKER